MSNRYKGGIISATPPTTTGGDTGVASGAWTLEQQLQAQAAGNWPIQPPVLYIEDVFSTWLYTGNGATQTITNGINLSGKGGLTLFKIRNTTYDWQAFDTARGPTKFLSTNGGGGESTNANSLTAFNSNGFTLGSAWTNDSGAPYASWTFREQPKFFDVVTYTGNGVDGRQISHTLGSTPGFVIVKRTDANANWQVRADAQGYGWNLLLNSTVAGDTSNTYANGNISGVSSTTFTVSNGTTNFNNVNANGGTYVAYLFAHNAGGFGLNGTDNVISCGSYTGTGATLNVNLGYEVQFVLIKPTSVAGNWTLMDNMRGMTPVGVDGTARLRPNISEAETALGGAYGAFPNATGFTVKSNPGVDDYNASGQTYIYIAIRRGPMATPTTGTSVFTPAIYTGNTTTRNITAGFPVDFYISTQRNGAQSRYAWDRLRGATQSLETQSTAAETSWSTSIAPKIDSNTGIQLQNQYFNSSGENWVDWFFRRAPGFFDEVCYSGTGVSNRVLNHNLGVPPELMIIKSRNSVLDPDWLVQCTPGPAGRFYFLNSNGFNTTAFPNITNITSTTVTLDDNTTNDGAGTYVAYFFASCPGVSKVGAFTGTGATQVIDCGFTTGARFVLIKSTNALGDWLVWDTARGMIPTNDPYLTLNTTAAEVTGTDWVDTAATGFELSNAGGNLANSNGVSYIYLAIA